MPVLMKGLVDQSENTENNFSLVLSKDNITEKCRFVRSQKKSTAGLTFRKLC